MPFQIISGDIQTSYGEARVEPFPDRTGASEAQIHPLRGLDQAREYDEIGTVCISEYSLTRAGQGDCRYVIKTPLPDDAASLSDPDIIRHADSHDPRSDIETINVELIAADRETVAKRQEKAAKMVKSGDKHYAEEADLAARLLAHLDELQPARTCPMSDRDREIAREWFLLTTKPVIYACNIREDDLGKPEDELPGVPDVKAIAAEENAKVLVISAKIEEDVAGMEPDEKAMFLEELGIGKSGLDRLITECYDLLGLISFLTAGEDECRAWTIKKGTKAPQAAGKIHTDFERGFIRAEIVSFEELSRLGSMAACKEKGLVRSEGKDYVMQDGDVTLFRFNV